jgi:hypothetical protein
VVDEKKYIPEAVDPRDAKCSVYGSDCSFKMTMTHFHSKNNEYFSGAVVSRTINNSHARNRYPNQGGERQLRSQNRVASRGN